MSAEQKPPSYPPLRSESAYVVQLVATAAGPSLVGRVEHVASGEATRFNSAEELLRFLSQPHALDEARRRGLEHHPYYQTLVR